jgi:hypothetical protein
MPRREAQQSPESSGPIVRPVSRWRPWLLGVIFWVALMPLTLRPRHSGNVWSRYMTIESLVERGTMAVERSPLRAMSGSPDLIRVGSHYYSDKPPVLTALGAGLYLPLWLAGQRLGRTPGEFVIVNAVLVSGLVGAFSGLSVVGVRQLLQCAPIRPIASDLLALGFAFSSLLLSYGVTFNNHSVACGGLTYALALAALAPSAGRRVGRFLVAGLLTGLAAATDLPAGGTLLASLAIWLAWQDRRVLPAFLAGSCGPLLLHAALQMSVTGSPLPAEMTPRVFEYPGSYWLTEAGRWRETGPRWQFGLELLLGYQGWLTVTPALVFGLVAIAVIVNRRGDPLRPLAIVAGGSVLVLLAYYTWGVRRTDFAGQSFGTRHLLAVSPIVFAFAVIGLARLRSRIAWALFLAAMAVGAVYAKAGLDDPWSRIERRSDPALIWVRKLALYPWSSYAR